MFLLNNVLLAVVNFYKPAFYFGYTNQVSVLR